MRRRLVPLIAVLAVLVAGGCGGDSDEGTPEGGGNTAAPDKVNVGVIPILDVAPIYLGKEKGFFSERNIELTLTTAQGGAAIAPAVVSGQYQFGFSNIVSLLAAQTRNLPLRVVSNGVASTGADGEDFASTLVKGDSPIQSAKDLAGKKVAVNTLKNIADTAVRASVRKAGGDPKAVQAVEMPFPDMPAALQSGQVDAAFMVEPFQSVARSQGARSIASSYVDTAPDLTVAAYFTTEQMLQENKDLVDRFTEAMKESLAFADANPEEARRIIGSYTEIDQAVIADLTLPKWPEEINRESVETLADLAIEDGTLTKEPDIDALIPTS